jgi:hypothetical protein
VVSDARLAPMDLAISAAHCSGGSEIISQPTTRPVIAGSPLCSDQNLATRSTQLKSLEFILAPNWLVIEHG